MKRSAAALAAGSLLWSATAAARDWPETAGWTIAEGDHSCGMMLEYEGAGDTELLVLLDVAGDVAMQMTNTNWTATKDQRYDIRWSINGYEFSGSSIGVEAPGGRRGFAGKFGANVVTELKAGRNLRVHLGDKLVDSLNLSGSAAALQVVERCVGTLRARLAAEQRDKDRLAHIPADPFAVAAPTPGVLRYNRDRYPPAAAAAGAEGDSKVRLSMDAEGRVTSCVVILSSGNPDLDETACRILRREARGRPSAQDERTVEWRLR